ncbi:MAG: hypothetical protein ACOC3V_04165 [bacterium]
MEKQGDSYYTRKYKLNSRVRELIEQKLGKQTELSYMEVENIIKSVYKGEYKSIIKELTESDKEKLMNMMKDSVPVNQRDKELDSIVSFLNDNYTKDEVKDYLDYCFKSSYNPGRVVSGVRISNDSLTKFMHKLNIYDEKQGIIINKKYVNDLIEFFDREPDKFKFDKETLLVEDDYTDELKSTVKELSKELNICYHNEESVFIIASDNDEDIKKLSEKFKYMKIQHIPEHFFDWIYNE